MLSALFALTLTPHQSRVVASFDGNDAGIRVVEQAGSIQAEFMVRERGKGFVVAAVSSGHVAANVIDRPFGELAFTQAKETDAGVVLTGKSFTATIGVPKDGGVFSVAVNARAEQGTLKSAVFGVALAPLAQPTRATFTFSPTTGLVTQDRLATPVALASGGGYGIALMPDVQDLVANRPMSPVLQVTDDARVSPATMLSYGFLPYDRDESWTPKLAGRNLDNPSEFHWRFDLLVTREVDTVVEANRFLWERDGAERSLSPLPQTVPFRYYTKPTYDMETTGPEAADDDGGKSPIGATKGLWWYSKDPEKKWRAPRGKDGLVKLTLDGNVTRFAWGLRWWGDYLLQANWSEQADEVIRLVAAAPRKSDMVTTSYDLSAKEWRYAPMDTSVLAFNARWALKYVEDFSSTSSEALLAYVADSAKEVMRGPLDGTCAVFLQELSTSKQLKDSALKRQIAEFLGENQFKVEQLAETYLDRRPQPTAESVATALFLARSGSRSGKALARRIVDNAFLTQAVVSPATVTGTEIFGAFVGEHFSEESQSLFTADLMDCVLQLGIRDYADRAVSALRAPLALFAHPTHGISGMYLPSSIGAVRSAPWFGKAGQAEFGEWRGVAEGVGQTLASLALVADEFGSMYTHKDGWTVGIDGIRLVDGKPYNAFSTNPFAFEGVFPVLHVDASTDDRTALTDPDHYPAMRLITLTKDQNRLFITALPGFTAIDAKNRLSGSFHFADGTTKSAEFLPTGLGVEVTEQELALGAVSFTGEFNKTPLSVKPTVLLSGPPAADQPWPMGWRRMRGLSDVVHTTVAADGRPVVSTADGGRGTRVSALIGMIESQRFLLSENGVKFTMYGGPDAGAYVELIDTRSGVVIASAQKRTEGPEEVTWELSDSVGSYVTFRLVDESKVGAIEVADLRVARIHP
jgi:hypothetical protein